MPIYGLTDQAESFKEIARVRLGIPKSEAAAHGPKALPHFRLDWRPGEEVTAERFVQMFGEHPTRILIRFPFRTIERVWDAHYTVYTRAGLLGKADGRKWLYLRIGSRLAVRDGVPLADDLPTEVDDEGALYVPFDPALPVYSYKGKQGQDVPVYAKPEGRLQFMIPELGRAAYLVMITHSIYNVIKLSGQLRGISTMAEQAGYTLPQVPVELSRRLETISVGFNGAKALQDHYLVNLEAILPGGFGELTAWNNTPVLGLPAAPALPPGVEEDDTPDVDDGEIEYFPDDQPGGADNDYYQPDVPEEVKPGKAERPGDEVEVEVSEYENTPTPLLIEMANRRGKMLKDPRVGNGDRAKAAHELAKIKETLAARANQK